MNSRTNTGRRARRLLAAVAAVAALASCGGGSTQYRTFVPNRLFVFGDETSYLSPTGLKYGINGYTSVLNPDGTTTTALNCGVLPNWVQTLASLWGFGFAQCNPNPLVQPQAYMLAQPGALSSDIQGQIDTQIANGGLGAGDLATVLAGANDIIADYKQYPLMSEAAIDADLGARARALGAQVDRLLQLGVKVILVTVPDMGRTPYAYNETALNQDVNRSILLTRLTGAFNDQLGVSITVDGSQVGLVQADQRTDLMADSPGGYGLANVTQGACLANAAPPACNTTTLVSGASASTWMWADDLNPSAAWQAQIGALAVARIHSNPF
ncbi:MAG: esterase [Burkholderiales bacterium]|nr:esterase [Burkholderiales bacterium]